MNRLLTPARPQAFRHVMMAAVSLKECRYRALPIEEGEETADRHWRIAEQTGGDSDPVEWSELWPAHHSVRPLALQAYDVTGPVEAGLRAIAPEAARLLVYRNSAIEERIARRTYQLEERIERLERAAFASSERGATLLNRAITELQSELGDELGDITPEEEAELWHMVDFSAVHEKD